jgi:hypothetical protein
MTDEKVVNEAAAAQAAASSLAASEAGRAMGKRRMALLGPKARRALAAHAGRAQWKGVSAAARSLEMRRRYVVRRRRKARLAILRNTLEKQAAKAKKA